MGGGEWKGGGGWMVILFVKIRIEMEWSFAAVLLTHVPPELPIGGKG